MLEKHGMSLASYAVVILWAQRFFKFEHIIKRKHSSSALRVCCLGNKYKDIQNNQKESI